ncbi:xylan alpha-(1-_2)-glucuronosidase [Spirochaetia bacterium]|nr:xylan alpha-(1->2)-glucuronosidase [Spirochaetia bacterium]
MDEYECWLQTRRFSTADTGSIPGKQVPSVIFAEGGNEVSLRAAEELRQGIMRVLGFSPAVFYGIIQPFGNPADKTKYAGTGRILLGTLRYLNETYNRVLPPLKPELPPEGFIITDKNDELIIAGADSSGVLYGVFRFLALLAQGELHDGFECREAPAARIRMIDHWDDTAGTVTRGYAGRSIFWDQGRLSYDPRRIEDYARLLASIGINRLTLNNVNVDAAGMRLYSEAGLKELVRAAAIFRPFGIRLFLAVNFASPMYLGGLATADPREPAVLAWWKDRADLIYQYLPDCAGFLVKADSEGEPGPFMYGRNQAEGANVLAAALKPHGGECIWRCFVYNSKQDWRDTTADRARAAYDYFKPLDGSFADNVILQIKYGPYDFQVQEPVSPLFGALKKTRYMLELQITQEYTGHQIDLCYLPSLWEDVMRFDTRHGPASTIQELLSNTMEGIAAVGNVGLDRNWTGHTLAQANFYGFGRMAWDPALSAAAIAREWSVLTFGTTRAAKVIAEILTRSYHTYAQYNAPFGVCFMVTPGTHYGPNIEGYEFDRWGTYHRADLHSIGIDRTAAGTGYTEQYSEHNAKIFADPAQCPENLILFFHRLCYDYMMKNGETLLQNIYDTHFEGYDEVEKMIAAWKGLKDQLTGDVYTSVLARMERQRLNAREWRDQVNTYFYRKTGIGDKKGRRIYD